jgi:hypothetical protein
MDSEMLGKIACKEGVGIALSAIRDSDETLQVFDIGFVAMRAYPDRI